jgi:Na+/melibiose symporter-like transporter
MSDDNGTGKWGARWAAMKRSGAEVAGTLAVVFIFQLVETIGEERGWGTFEHVLFAALVLIVALLCSRFFTEKHTHLTIEMHTVPYGGAGGVPKKIPIPKMDDTEKDDVDDKHSPVH